MSAEDRIALILGRSIMRAEALQSENERLGGENERLRAELSERDETDPADP